MAILVEVSDETSTLTAKQMEQVESVLKHAAALEQLEGEYEVSVSFVDEDEIRQINHGHRGIDRGTDVLSFALNEGVEEVAQSIEGMPNLLGDIIISTERITQQAKEYEHSFERELGFLIVHGFLHLLGYDHMDSEEEKVMFKRQEEILTSYGLVR
ncbi:rRNA maturation RNase YbeY [Alkalicoccobacillus porphyridii]|uniref:Endoribonuclease YbeY n=1 Tax=Alkalicoccobacillus porphyridii TaxID=2597270 RepID=A0A553ZZ98_9BACI|nr:rRNA maturation RNase YbeY [Alkalicoccobacillus porphyridii]TSB46759.1 rRNA maturation RNase YbeY [Alkalicoccobacillus porphyridii]